MCQQAALCTRPHSKKTFQKLDFLWHFRYSFGIFQVCSHFVLNTFLVLSRYFASTYHIFQLVLNTFPVVFWLFIHTFFSYTRYVPIKSLLLSQNFLCPFCYFPSTFLVLYQLYPRIDLALSWYFPNTFVVHSWSLLSALNIAVSQDIQLVQLFITHDIFVLIANLQISPDIPV